MKNQAQKNIASAYAHFTRLFAVNIAFTLVCILCGWCIVHMVNKFPGLYARNDSRRLSSIRLWKSACSDSGIESTEHVDCDGLRTDATMIVMSQTVEDVVTHMMGHFNVFRWVGCSPGSMCHFVLFKAIDYACTNWLTALVMVGVVAVLYIYWAGRTRTSWLEYQMAINAAQHQRQIGSFDRRIECSVMNEMTAPVTMEMPRRRIAPAPSAPNYDNNIGFDSDGAPF